MYYEIAYQRQNNEGKYYFDRCHLTQEAKVDMTPTEVDRYVSMFGFDQSIQDWVEFNKTVSGFNGYYSCKYLYFDVDNENLEAGLESARELVTRLYSKLNINPKSLFISFSGSKGFHIGLHQKLFGGFEASQKMPDQIRALAINILATAYDTTMAGIQEALSKIKVKVFKDVDLGIYNQNRIFRTINSKNHKSGLYKIGLTSRELFDLSIDGIKELAQNPRTNFRTDLAVKELQVNAELHTLWADALRFDPQAFHEAYMKSQAGGTVSKREGAFFAPPVKGGRNQELFTQACMIFDRSDFAEESVRQLISCINLASPEPLPEDEIKTIVRSANRRTVNNKKPILTSPVSDNSLESFNNWFDEWVEYYTKEAKKLSCIFREIDEDQEYNYEGKLCCLIGKGGSRKSFFAQNILGVNVLNHDALSIYSSMEMGKVEVVNRLLDIMLDPIDDNISSSESLKGMVRQDKEGTRKGVKDTFAHIDEHLILNNQAFMTAEEYDKMIEKSIQVHGGIRMLVVDGLSAMGGKGTETEVYSKNTLALKEIAKKYNVFVVLICHTTKEAKPYIRDPAPFVRGSEKILDNCDFTIGFSQLIDKYSSTPDNLTYSRTYGHIKYWNKRGTGLTINKIYFFESQTKKFKETTANLDDFPTYEKFVADFNKKNKSRKNDDF